MKKAIVVGSGAGGCMVAKELSKCFDVTLLEAGGAFHPFKYDLNALEPLRRMGLFFDERMIQLLFPEMRVLKARGGRTHADGRSARMSAEGRDLGARTHADGCGLGELVHVDGRGLGGTTTLATGNAVRADSALRDIGIDLSPEFEELAAEVPMTREHYRSWSDLTVRLFAAFEELGYDPQVTPKFMEDAGRCVACGHCVLGCRFGAKWTADRLLDSCENVIVKTGCTVERVVVEGGEARGVVVRERGGSLLAADLVVLAAGGLNTPVILNASGVPTKPILFVDPVICVAAPWREARLEAQLPMPFVSQRDGYILSPYFDWLSFFFNGAWRTPAPDIMSIMVKYADSEQGSFDGKHLDKPFSARDEATIARSVEEASRVLEQVGVARGDMFLGTLNAGHPGGCLPLTGAEANTLHHAALPPNLYVADASLLPHSLGNPPILTIMALAKRVARHAASAMG